MSRLGGVCAVREDTVRAASSEEEGGSAIAPDLTTVSAADSLGMQRLQASIRTLFRGIACDAARSGFPAFPGGEALSNPFNASPYLVDLFDLRQGLLVADRSPLISALCDALRRLRSLDAEAGFLLIGGSALDPAATPRDLDCIVFYSAGPDLQPSSLAAFQRTQQDAGLDLRFVPLDGDPALLLKAALFFGSLYGRSRQGGRQDRGMLLVDCRNMGEPA